MRAFYFSSNQGSGVVPVQLVLITISVSFVDLDAQMTRMGMSPTLATSTFSNLADKSDAGAYATAAFSKSKSEQSLEFQQLLKPWHSFPFRRLFLLIKINFFHLFNISDTQIK